MHCEFLERCPFFNDRMPLDQGIGSIFKQKYCLSDYPQCARYAVGIVLGPASVPLSLYPNMHDISRKILAEATSNK